jgi:hypothetical protein
VGGKTLEHPVFQKGEKMTERKIGQLYRLLGEFAAAKARDGRNDYFTSGEKAIIDALRTWARWYARDELDCEVKK